MPFSRSVSLAGSLVGVVFNLALMLPLLALSRSLRWESESEWESSNEAWMVDSVRIVWGLLCAYYTAASALCLLGFVGLAKRIRLFVRVYRDYSIADVVFVTLATIFACYSSFNSPYLRSLVCEELSRHPELMRDMGDMGLSLENCEQWFERAVIAAIGVMSILIVVRIHIVIALSQYYSAICRDSSPVQLRTSRSDLPMQRIYLMSTPSGGRPHHHSARDDFAVYAPVPLGDITVEEARQMQAMEAWIPTNPAGSPWPRHHSHSHPHSHSHSHSHSHRTHPAARWESDEKRPLAV